MAEEVKLKQFLTEVKVIEKRDEKWTSDKQIERLLKPGAKYINLNPFEVLQLEPTSTPEEQKKRFRKTKTAITWRRLKRLLMR
eukprot:m.227665 g.227665  ORF g.227665 m.227665 type:complete len:83 (-) comp26416_c0_seq3:3243-3491(-)